MLPMSRGSSNLAELNEKVLGSSSQKSGSSLCENVPGDGFVDRARNYGIMEIPIVYFLPLNGVFITVYELGDRFISVPNFY